MGALIYDRFEGLAVQAIHRRTSHRLLLMLLVTAGIYSLFGDREKKVLIKKQGVSAEKVEDECVV